MQNKKAKKKTKELEELFDKEVIIDNWIYNPYLKWLSDCKCEESVKKKLNNLTQKMKSRGLD